MNQFVKKILSSVISVETLRSRSLVAQGLGLTKSNKKGNGVSFKGLRPYVYGDNVKHIDWVSTAKNQGQLYMKEYEEEKSQPLVILMDVRQSMRFHSRGESKNVVASIIGASLARAYSSLDNPVGFITFNKGVENYTKPNNSEDSFYQMISKFEAKQDTNDIFDFQLLINNLSQMKAKNLDVIVFSDFLNMKIDFKKLNALCFNTNIRLIRILDALEKNPTPISNTYLRNMVSNQGISSVSDDFYNDIEQYPAIKLSVFEASTSFAEKDIAELMMKIK